ncbi:MAG: electron transfer flavoprotein subunit alpha, partial [Chloroflexi bacterium CG07_land_8_20_14_0_80_51_10]
MAEYKGVLIGGEVAEGKIAPITLELLGIGRKLADDLGEELSVLLLGSSLSEAARGAIVFGADKVYIADDPLLSDYNSDTYTAAVTKACEQLSPSILLLGQTDMGRDIAPRVAARLRTGLSVDCIELGIDPHTKLLIQTRPVYGGNALATMVCESARPQMATVRFKSMSALPPDDSRQGEITNIDLGIDASAIKSKFVERVKEEAEGIKLEDANVVIGGGRGVGSAENFDMLWELAHLFGGAVGGTRVACDEGWLASTLQIGQTGKIVSPNLYIAVGLSGAMQHIAGCSGAKNIVAINKDPEANIFKVAHYGVVGDFKQALPALTEKCKELLG